MDLTRRQLCLAFPVALLPALLAAESAQQPTALPSSMYPFDKLPVQTSNGAQFRAVLKGKLATGESLEVHETTLPAGSAPHPPHHHVHSEMWLVRESSMQERTRLLGGTWTLQSEPGGGTQISVSIPVSACHGIPKPSV